MKTNKLLLSLSIAGALALQFADVPAARAQVYFNEAIPQNYCREYTQTLTIGNKTQTGYGTACLQPDGSWQLQPRATQSFNYIMRDNYVFVRPPQPFVDVSLVFPGHVHVSNYHGHNGYGHHWH